ncbi:MAG TPA: hypothetical protein VGI22_27670, partial [Xanthobacteraceae bacterium]
LRQSPAAPDSRHRDPPAAASGNSRYALVGYASEESLPVLVEPWPMTENDIPWLYDLCKKRYPGKYDSVTTEGWFRNIVLKQPVLFHPVRMRNAFCISMLSILPWMPSDIECTVVFVCADDGCMWEAMKCLRSSVEWGRLRKCSVWRLCSDTDYELKAIAHRLGATEQSPRYCIRY